MKLINNLYHAINDVADNLDDPNRPLTFAESQYEELGEKHILFVDVQLSGRNLYRAILPYFGLPNEQVKTAISNITKYNQREQLIDLDLNLTTKEIFWADFIVFPFTTQNLSVGDINLYDFIRSINTQCKIIYCIDFNFYELSDKHPYKDIFTDDAIVNVENNIWKSDMVLLSNMPLRDYMLERLQELSEGRMKNIPTSAGIACMPFYIDSEIALQNVDFDPQEPIKIINTNKRSVDAKKKINKVEKNKTQPKKEEVELKQIRVIYEEEKWVLKKGKDEKPIERYATKSLAIDETEKWIKKGYDIIIYKMDNTVQKHIENKNQKDDSIKK